MRNSVLLTFLFLPRSLLFAEPAGKKPNIIFILVDDRGFSDLGCYGSEIPTPNIVALAGSGLRFTQMYNTATPPGQIPGKIQFPISNPDHQRQAGRLRSAQRTRESLPECGLRQRRRYYQKRGANQGAGF